MSLFCCCWYCPFPFVPPLSGLKNSASGPWRNLGNLCSHDAGLSPRGIHFELFARLSRHVTNWASGHFGVDFKRADNCLPSPPSQGHSVPAQSRYQFITICWTLVRSEERRVGKECRSRW